MDLSTRHVQRTNPDASSTLTPQASHTTQLMVPLFASAAVFVLIALSILTFVVCRWHACDRDDKQSQRGFFSEFNQPVRDLPHNETSTTANDASAGFSVIEVRESQPHSKFSSASWNSVLSELPEHSPSFEPNPSPQSAVSTVSNSFAELDDLDPDYIQDFTIGTVLPIHSAPRPKVISCSQFVLSGSNFLEADVGPEQDVNTPVKSNNGPSSRIFAGGSDYVAIECRGEIESSVSSDRASQADIRDTADPAQFIVNTHPLTSAPRSTDTASHHNSISFQLLDGSALVRDVYLLLPTDKAVSCGIGIEIFGASSSDSFPSVALVRTGSPLTGRVFESDYIVRLNDASTEGLDEERVLQLIGQDASAVKLTVVTLYSDVVSDKCETGPAGRHHPRLALEV